jgi:hypothetical protein
MSEKFIVLSEVLVSSGFGADADAEKSSQVNRGKRRVFFPFKMDGILRQAAHTDRSRCIRIDQRSVSWFF